MKTRLSGMPVTATSGGQMAAQGVGDRRTRSASAISVDHLVPVRTPVSTPGREDHRGDQDDALGVLVETAPAAASHVGWLTSRAIAKPRTNSTGSGMTSRIRQTTRTTVSSGVEDGQPEPAAAAPSAAERGAGPVPGRGHGASAPAPAASSDGPVARVSPVARREWPAAAARGGRSVRGQQDPERCRSPSRAAPA